jgi:hypothetical protein
VACPITTGIFAWMAAHAADEALSAGETRVTPLLENAQIQGRTEPQIPRRSPRDHSAPRS